MNTPQLLRSRLSIGKAGWPAAAGLPQLNAGDAVHLVGMGGAGMQGLAMVMLQRGIRVSGSDRDSGTTLRRLRQAGALVFEGHAADQVPPDCTLLVRSPAVPMANVEVQAALRNGIPVGKRAELLGALLDHGRGAAVAGTHGKTTTAGWLATVLVMAGHDPTVFVGGHVDAIGGHARSGGPDEIIVLEADEYDLTFHHGHPLVAIITNIEHDHPDIFTGLAETEEAFRGFAALVRPEGHLIVWAGTTSLPALVKASAAPVATYAVSGDELAAVVDEPTWLATPIQSSSAGQHFEVRRGADEMGPFEIRLHGRHSIANALATIAAATELGLTPAEIRPGLAAYDGAERRMQVLGQAGGVIVVDDYAHHPTEVAATLEGARSRWPVHRLWAVLQPHTYSRVATMAEAFADALSGADNAVITPVFGARERSTDFPGVDANSIGTHVPAATVISSLEEAAQLVASAARTDDVIIFLGAGDITAASKSALRMIRLSASRRVATAANERGLGGRQLTGEVLARFTSLKIGGPADLIVVVDDVDDLAAWIMLAREFDAPWRVIGRGTNILAPDQGLGGLTIVNRCEEYFLEEHGDTATVHADAGVTLAALGHAMARTGWAGLEAAVGIPGSMGGSVVTNAGAHGWTMDDVLLRAEILEADGRRQWLSVSELRPAYRSSILKGDHSRVVLRVELALKREDPATILERIARFTAHRRGTQPTTPSVGSIFRNPEGDFAGRLIEAAGLKGERTGGAQISPTHANFFVNTGHATALDILALIDLARLEVRQQFGIELQLEIEQWSNDDGH